MGDDDNPAVLTEVEQPASHGAVLEHAEGDLDCRDLNEIDRLLQLPSVDVRQPDVSDRALIEQPPECAHRGRPRRPWIWSMDEEEIDGQAVKRCKARLAPGKNRVRAAVRKPAAAGAGHPTFGDDLRPPRGAAPAERAS